MRAAAACCEPRGGGWGARPVGRAAGSPGWARPAKLMLVRAAGVRARRPARNARARSGALGCAAWVRVSAHWTAELPSERGARRSRACPCRSWGRLPRAKPRGGIALSFGARHRALGPRWMGRASGGPRPCLGWDARVSGKPSGWQQGCRRWREEEEARGASTGQARGKPPWTSRAGRRVGRRVRAGRVTRCRQGEGARGACGQERGAAWRAVSWPRVRCRGAWPQGPVYVAGARWRPGPGYAAGANWPQGPNAAAGAEMASGTD